MDADDYAPGTDIVSIRNAPFLVRKRTFVSLLNRERSALQSRFGLIRRRPIAGTSSANSSCFIEPGDTGRNPNVIDDLLGKKALTLEYTPGCMLNLGFGSMQIGALSKQSGLRVDAIRFYEKQRLVPSPRRSGGGFRLFGEEDLAALRFIKSAQELGFSLDEIRELWAIRRDSAEACPTMRGLLRTKLTSVDSKISRLKVLRAELKSALRKCEVALGRSRKAPSHNCPVLDDISGKQRLKGRV